MTSIPRATAAPISATEVVPQSTVTMSVAPAVAGRLDGGHRQAVALVQARWHVGRDRHAQRAQGEDQDGQPGQAVGVEVAEDHDRLAGLAGRGDARRRRRRRRAAGAGRGGRRAAPRTRPRRSRASRTPRVASRPVVRSVRPRPLPARSSSGKVRRRGSGRSSESAVPARAQDATSACTPTYPGLRTSRGAVSASDPSRSGRAGGPPSDASPRGAGSPRRSTSTCRR